MDKQSEAHSPLAPHISDTAIEEILDDVNGYTNGPVSGFFPKYFTAPSSQDFLQWFLSFSLERFNGARGTWHPLYHPNYKPKSFGGAHIFLTLSTTFDHRAKNRWLDVQVIGQFCEDETVEYQDGLLNLCGYAREVFASQPTLLFLHGFYIRGSFMELWVFDRSGIYSCDIFDIRNEFTRFLSVVVSYRLMSNRDLGMSNIIEIEEAGRCITLEDAAITSLRELYLEDQPIAFSQELVGKGTTCYRAKTLDKNGWDYVVKFKWHLASKRPEEELLKLVKEKNVWGVVSLDYHKEVASTENLRQGLQCGLGRRFLTTRYQKTGSGEIEEQGSGLLRGTKGVTEHTEKTIRTFEDRIFTCVVVSPAGRPLRTFENLIELLQVFRDAVKGHRSLYQNTQIPHQDVSAENIIITGAQVEGKPKGIMIDLDVAMSLAVEPKTPGEMIGTRPFMSIGILKGRPHTYRHDLESFLYVFLWTVISNRAENPPKTSKLRRWVKGSWHELATQKTIDMDKDSFGSILSEFTLKFHCLKPLAKTLRQTLFPLHDGTLWTGTDSSPEGVNELYDGIIDAFEEAITFIDKTSA